MSVANPSVMPRYCMVMLTHRVAKEKKLRVWKNYQPTTSAMSVAEKAYVAKVWHIFYTFSVKCEFCCLPFSNNNNLHISATII